MTQILADNEKLTKIILADDHEVVRAGLRRLLAIDKTLEIIAEASNGEDAVELVRHYHPHIALLDILMPKMDGIEATKLIKEEFDDVLVVMLTAFEDFNHIEKALSAGADGYLSKDIGAKELVKALNEVNHGERVFSKSVLRLLQRKFRTSEIEEEMEIISISKREQEILNQVALGKTSIEIAEALNISARTVHSHRANIMDKLGIKNTAGLVRYAIFHSKDY